MSTTAAPGPPAATDDDARRARWAVIAIAILAIAAFSLPYSYVGSLLGKSQDLPITGVLCVFLLVAKGGKAAWLNRVAPLVGHGDPGWRLPTAGAALFALAAFGPSLVMGGHQLSRDEQMVLFDAEVFARGDLVAAVPTAWQGRLDELHTTYMRVAHDGSAWISSYLPVNAAAHAIGLRLGVFGAVAPAFAALGLVSTWGAARRLFPGQPRLPVVATVLYLTSSQVWITAMTPYAMSGHLALNMTWLWLALGPGVRRQAGAAIVSVLAVGLHQLLFHPLFCLPFLAAMAVTGRLRAAITHAAVLVAAMLAWTIYPSLIMAEGATDGRADGIVGLLVHAVEIFWPLKSHALGSMAGNILRFFVWQNLALLPLLGAAYWVARSSKSPMLAALWGTLILTPVVAALLIPEEHHGWGYRYMHGQIGTACLLGAAGFRALDKASIAARGFVAAGVAVALAIQLPFLAVQTARFVAPFAEASAALDRTPGPTVRVEPDETGLAIDLVYNGSALTPPVRLMPTLEPLPTAKTDPSSASEARHAKP